MSVIKNTVDAVAESVIVGVSVVSIATLAVSVIVGVSVTSMSFGV